MRALLAGFPGVGDCICPVIQLGPPPPDLIQEVGFAENISGEYELGCGMAVGVGDGGCGGATACAWGFIDESFGLLNHSSEAGGCGDAGTPSETSLWIVVKRCASDCSTGEARWRAWVGLGTNVLLFYGESECNDSCLDAVVINNELQAFEYDEFGVACLDSTNEYSPVCECEGLVGNWLVYGADFASTVTLIPCGAVAP